MDAMELIDVHATWAGNAEVTAFRCEVDRSGDVSFVDLYK